MYRPQFSAVLDHPRRCGENSYAVTRFSSILGSPPQVRGKPSSPVTSVNPPQDHPRRCGENSLSSSSCRSRSGSPPQVRGKPEFHLLSLRYRRITPAGAGKTWLFGFLWCVRWDHPRRCGENVITCISGAGISGSPPQVRGKLGCPRVSGKHRRDHPRRCGENLSTFRHHRK